MNISEIILYLPETIAAFILIALSIVAIAMLPWRSEELEQGKNEFSYVLSVCKEKVFRLLGNVYPQSLIKAQQKTSI
jgi:hypothetical protein